jgi:hypothetical protein
MNNFRALSFGDLFVFLRNRVPANHLDAVALGMISARLS